MPPPAQPSPVLVKRSYANKSIGPICDHQRQGWATELNVKVREKIIDLMEGEQKEKWKEKVGEPFKGVLPFGPPMESR
jgi:hypothetical protein